MRLILPMFCLFGFCFSSSPAGEDAEIAVISHGERVKLEDYLVAGRWILFDFYADWCVPCRKWSPMMEKLAQDYPEHLVLYKVDIRNWGTAVALQYEIERIPYVMLYNENGKRVAKGSPREIVEKLQKRAIKEQWQ